MISVCPLFRVRRRSPLRAAYRRTPAETAEPSGPPPLGKGPSGPLPLPCQGSRFHRPGTPCPRQPTRPPCFQRPRGLSTDPLRPRSRPHPGSRRQRIGRSAPQGPSRGKGEFTVTRFALSSSFGEIPAAFSYFGSKSITLAMPDSPTVHTITRSWKKINIPEQEFFLPPGPLQAAPAGGTESSDAPRSRHGQGCGCAALLTKPGRRA
jgi:hypothetical protein